MNRTVIIVGGGRGTRMGGEIPKQFMELEGKPLIMHTIEVFYQWDQQISLIIALPEELFGEWEKLCMKHHFTIEHERVPGGKTRFHSVLNALEKANDEALIGVHDAVRPFVSMETLERCYQTAESHGTAVPCVEIRDSVRGVDEEKNFPVDRSKIVAIQTPQVFRSAILKSAYRQEYDHSFTDDAGVVESAGYSIRLITGNRGNFKITDRDDFDLARAYFRSLPD